MSALLLRPTEGDFIGVAMLDASPPEGEAGGALFGAGSGEVAAEIAEVRHSPRE